jgi:hypothetical protein
MRRGRISALLRLFWIFTFTTLGTLAHSADETLIGTWRLISFAAQDVETGTVTRPWGDAPAGFLTYTRGGRMSAVLTAEQRQAESGSAEQRMQARAKLFMTQTAYAGTYTLTPDGVVHHVEVASFPDWVGRDQVRYASLDGDTLTIKTPPLPRFPDLRMQVFTLTWRRVE